MARVIDRPPVVAGLDLGNRFCRMAAWRSDEQPPMLMDAGGSPSYPAVVAYDSDDSSWLCGDAAWESSYRQSVTLFTHLCRGVDQDLGTHDGTSLVRRLLFKLKHAFQRDYAGRIVNTVLVTPHNYTLRQRMALRRAAESAGVPVKALINAPEAAVLGYRFDESLGGNESANVLVFDAGASRCTVSIVRASKIGAYLDIELLSEAEAVTEEGELVGGDWIDARLMAAWKRGALSVPARPEDVSEPGDSIDDVWARDEQEAWEMLQFEQRLRQARHQLSTAAEFEFEVPWSTTETARLTRDDLERYADLSEAVANAVAAALSGAVGRGGEVGLTREDIDRVLIVGGLNRSPLVSRLVDQFVNIEPREEGFEEVATVGGAARAAAILTGGIDSIRFEPRETPAFGVRTGADTFDKVIPENAPIGFTGRKMFDVSDRFAKRLDIEVCQGFSRRFTDDISLGRESITLDRPHDVAEGAPVNRKLELCMTLNDGKVDVEIHDRTDGLQGRDRGPWNLSFHTR